MKAQLEAIKALEAHGGMVDFVLCCASPDDILAQLIDCTAAKGHICTIVNFTKPAVLGGLFWPKSLSLHFELMFARPLNSAHAQPQLQGDLLALVARLVDAGKLRTTATTVLPWSAESFRRAHEICESGAAIGKVVVTRADVTV
jgi:NADPH:quinone reductase-like Zn-dependent oxidoreductase